MTEMRADFN